MGAEDHETLLGKAQAAARAWLMGLVGLKHGAIFEKVVVHVGVEKVADEKEPSWGASVRYEFEGGEDANGLVPSSRKRTVVGIRISENLSPEIIEIRSDPRAGKRVSTNDGFANGACHYQIITTLSCVRRNRSTILRSTEAQRHQYHPRTCPQNSSR